MPSETSKDASSASDDIRALLEKGLIDEYLKNKGYDRASLKKLPEDEYRRLMTEASIYASGKLTEIETKARFKETLKDTGS
jgi:hypothetical protein